MRSSPSSPGPRGRVFTACIITTERSWPASSPTRGSNAVCRSTLCITTICPGAPTIPAASSRTIRPRWGASSSELATSSICCSRSAVGPMCKLCSLSLHRGPASLAARRILGDLRVGPTLHSPRPRPLEQRGYDTRSEVATMPNMRWKVRLRCAESEKPAPCAASVSDAPPTKISTARMSRNHSR